MTNPGDNQPPDDLETLRLRLDAATATVKARILDIRVALERVPAVITPEIEGHVSDQIQQGRDALADLEAIRVAIKRPIDARIEALQEHFRLISGLIGLPRKDTGIFAKIQTRYDDYIGAKAKADTERQLAETKQWADEHTRRLTEAMRLQAEASEAARGAVTEGDRQKAGALAEQASHAAVAAEAPGPSTNSIGRVRGMGSTTHVASRWIFEITDASKITRDYLMPDEAKIQRAVTVGLRNIPGIRIFETHKAIVKAT